MDLQQVKLSPTSPIFTIFILAMAKGIDLEGLITAVAGHMKIDVKLVISSSRQRAVSKARSI